MVVSMSSIHGVSRAACTLDRSCGLSQSRLCVRAHPRQCPAQRVLADDLAHAQNLRADTVTAQRGDMRIAMVARQNRQEPGSQERPAYGISALPLAVAQRATVQPRTRRPRQWQETRRKRPVARSGWRWLRIPANLNAATRRLHRKRLQRRTIERKSLPLATHPSGDTPITI
jgi:hypothetical protein